MATHSDDEIRRLVAGHDPTKHLPSGKSTSRSIDLASVPSENVKGVLWIATGEPMRVFHVAGESETLIGTISPRERDYIFEPEGWSPPSTLEGPQFLQLARQAWMLYYHQLP